MDIALIVQTVTLYAIPVLFAQRQATRIERYMDATLVFGVPLLAFGFQLRLMREIEYGAAFSALASSLVYIVLARLVYTRHRELLRMLVEAFLALGVRSNPRMVSSEATRYRATFGKASKRSSAPAKCWSRGSWPSLFSVSRACSMPDREVVVMTANRETLNSRRHSRLANHCPIANVIPRNWPSLSLNPHRGLTSSHGNEGTPIPLMASRAACPL